MSSDRIHLHHLTFYGHHGVYEAERQLGQKVVIDLDLFLDLSAAGRTDDLTQSLDYTLACRVVRQVVEERQFKLLEALAEAVAQELLALPRVRGVEVQVRKMAVPVPAAYVAVVLKRGDTA